MASLPPHFSLRPLSSLSSSSSSTTCLLHFPLHPITFHCFPTPLKFPLLYTSCSSSSSSVHPTNLLLHPIFLFASFDRPLDTQTFLVTVSVLAAIALSLFLGLKVRLSSTIFLGFIEFVWVWILKLVFASNT